MRRGKAWRAIDIMGVVLFVVLISFTYSSTLKNPDRYMKDVSVIIPDEKYGEDVYVIYNRHVVRDFYAKWVAKVFKVEEAYKHETTTDKVCHGVGESYYSRGVETILMSLEKFVNLPSCRHLQEGIYYVQVYWIINGDTDITQSYTTNNFTIYNTPVILD